jgi:hypothetical protein
MGVNDLGNRKEYPTNTNLKHIFTDSDLLAANGIKIVYSRDPSGSANLL